MDIVFIRGLEVRAIIGVRDWERQVKQTVVLNLEMETDVEAAAATDDIDGTLSYSDAAKALQTFVGNSSFQLIETLAEQIAALVMAEFGVGWLRLELIKPRPLSRAPRGRGRYRAWCPRRRARTSRHRNYRSTGTTGTGLMIWNQRTPSGCGLPKRANGQPAAPC